MKTNSEKSFGARVNNAITLLQILKSFVGYDPGTDGLYIADYQAMIDIALRLNSEIAAELVPYSTAVETRQKLVRKDKNAICKIMTPLLGAVRSSRRTSPKDISYMESPGKQNHRRLYNEKCEATDKEIYKSK